MRMDLREDFRAAFDPGNLFDAMLALDGKVYRKHDNRRTLRITKDGKGYFIKIHRRTSLGELAKNIYRFRLPVTSSWNEVNAIMRLEELGIPTMKLVGYGVRGLPPLWLDSFVITEELENTISLEDFCRDWDAAAPMAALKRAMIRKVASIAARMHRNGVNHRDFYLCHFLLDRSSLPKGVSPGDFGNAVGPPAVQRADVDSLVIYLIDLHRVQQRKKTPERWIIKDLSGLFFSAMDAGLTRRDLFRFMTAYSGKPLRVILRDERSFWLSVARKASGLYRKHFHRNPPIAGDR